MPHFTRWKEFAGMLSPHTLYAHMGQAHQGSLLMQAGPLHVIRSCVPGNTWDMAPQLRYLKLNLTYEPLGMISLRRFEVIPWFQLTHLTIETHHPDIALQILQYARKIECFELCTATTLIFGLRPEITSFLDLEDPLHIIHPTMLSMSMTTASGSDSSARLISNLTLPALQNLDVAQDLDGPVGALALVKRSQCSLLSLKILGCQSTPHVASLLRVTPALEELNIHSRDTSILHLLNLNNLSGMELVPKLRSLDITIGRMTTDSIGMEDFLAMLESRWTPEDGPRKPSSGLSKLKHVTLVCVYSTNLTNEILGRLKKLIREGMDITILCDRLSTPYDRIRLL
ncbi:hypothetical protein HWV62_21960 [Athelia sp. TMB]|nr:hypothetical protein HWV62_21960 [Athelia sp. TMB]